MRRDGGDKGKGFVGAEELTDASRIALSYEPGVGLLGEILKVHFGRCGPGHSRCDNRNALECFWISGSWDECFLTSGSRTVRKPDTRSPCTSLGVPEIEVRAVSVTLLSVTQLDVVQLL